MTRDEFKRIRAGVAKQMIERGWNPPPPSTKAMHRILDDIAEVREEDSGFAGAPTLELSPRERQCLQFAAQGMDKHEIADDLGVGFETVKTFWRKIFDKLGARNQAHAVAIGIREGIIEPATNLGEREAA